MRVRATREGDVRVGGHVKALFRGQFYDLPEDVVNANDWLEPAEQEKSLGGPPSNKAIGGPPRVKGGNQ